MKAVLVVFITICGLCAKAQTVPNFDLIKLEKATDYKIAEPFVLQTATYLLSTPYIKASKDRNNSLQFISKWMYGTTDYAFVFNDVVDKIGKDNNELLGMYMAAMAKYALQNKAVAKDQKQLKINAMILLLNYCENKDNNMRMSKQLKKMAEAKEKGQLEQAF